MRRIELTQNKFAVVDDEDFEKLNQYSWSINNARPGYARAHSWINGKIWYMHRFILNITDSKIQVDHINGDPLDNRRVNLRLCSIKENLRNSKIQKDNKTGYKGVQDRSSRGLKKPFCVRIKVDDKEKFLGYYETAIEGAKAYDEAAKKYFGEFARLNFMEKK